MRSSLSLSLSLSLSIYLEPTVQRKVMPTFYYALKPGGFLFVGASESIGSLTELFAAGAVAYLTKESAADALCQAIEAAISYEENQSSIQS